MYLQLLIENVFTAQSWSCFSADDYYFVLFQNKGNLKYAFNLFEKEVNISGSHQTLTMEKLKKAGEMFVYLAYCHDIANDWLMFYEQLFHYQTLNQIILALNKISKVTTINYPSKFVKINDIERKILEKIENLFALQFKNITKGIDSTIRRKEISDVVTGQI